MLRPETITFIRDNLSELTDEQRARFSSDRTSDEENAGEAVGPIMAELGIFDQPAIFSWTVLIEQDGPEYVITPDCAIKLAAGDELVPVEVLGKRPYP